MKFSEFITETTLADIAFANFERKYPTLGKKNAYDVNASFRKAVTNLYMAHDDILVSTPTYYVDTQKGIVGVMDFMKLNKAQRIAGDFAMIVMEHFGFEKFKISKLTDYSLKIDFE